MQHTAAPSWSQTDTKILKSQLKYTYIILMKFEFFFFFSFFHFHFKEIFGFWVFFKCWYSSQRQTKKSSEEQLPGVNSFVRTSLFSCSVVSNSATLWTAACQASLSFTVSWSLFKLMSIELMIPSKDLILCHPLLLPSIFPSTKIFTSLVQSIGASASVLTMNIQGWFPLGLTCLLSLLSKGLSRVFSSTTFWNHQFFGTQPSLWFNSHFHPWLPKNP